MDHVLLQNGVEHPVPGEEHKEDSSMKVEVAFDGVQSPFRFRHKKRSKVWEEYKPIFLNGKVQFAECLYCHNRLSCKDSNGTSHLWRHQKICPGKEEAAQRRQKDSYFPCVLVNRNDPVSPHDLVSEIITETLSDIKSVTPSGSRFTSKVWKEFTPIYVEGKLQAADCIHCHKRLSANKFGGRSHLSRHLITCAGRHGRGQIHQKGLFYPSSIPSLKSKMQDELSPALTNGKVQIAEYSSKLLRTSSSGDSTPKPIRVVPAQHSLPTPDCTSLKKQRTSFVTTPIGQETSDPELAGMIAMHGYPLSIVEHEEMVRFVNKLNPVVNLVSRNGLEEHCLALFQKEKENLKSKIAHSSRRVSLSASIWTPDGSEPTVNYLCLTAHYVDEDWKVHRIIIKFGMFWSVPADLERMVHCMEACVPESESGSYNIISDAIRDWNLDQKLLSLISVGEVRDDNNTSLLKEMLIEKKFLPIGGKLYNVSCVDYILNSIVFKVQSDILHLVSDIVMEFLVSLTQQQLLEVISHMGLKCPQEDAKWWHKLYFRLEVLLHFKKSFPSDERLSPEDTKIVESVCKILRTFYRVIEVISSPSSPTANMYFNEIWKIRTVLQEEALNDHRDIATMVMMMQEAFNEYWQNSYLWLAIPVVLDPRFKFSFIEFRLKRAFGTDSASYLSVIRETVRELFNEYCNSLNQTIAVVSNSEAFGADDGDSLEDWDRHLHEQASSQLSSELDDYLEDGLVPRKDDFDILNWWMTHTTKYPTLATIARDILAMPASAVQSEAAFSSSGPVIPKHQSALNIRTIEALVCTRDWMR
ncbi:zinc finger BED domain-containing protein RICESLEEPER 1-like isoform X1 [Oryza brachyantha]|uniref:BED-type domain-containing protein n=1 Tax=Oryza brachyantha TaxID=4533 RepID=J3M1N0_ORYBR|nr:zinc finger BED domain-containing protein RICESLEEPER 1-like isoform X1 [Oryza brachyantha]XP_015692325.1 zinc finger BED domain-containing protein RICESLEEPER 1-like isoform X1 [Oryza brachyantha]